MCIVIAGGNVYAANEKGTTVSRAVCQHGHEELWREVLAECGGVKWPLSKNHHNFGDMWGLLEPGTRVT